MIGEIAKIKAREIDKTKDKVIHDECSFDKEIEEEIKKLTWKFFWQQKFKEVGIPFCCLIGFIFIPYIIGVVLDYLGFHLGRIALKESPEWLYLWWQGLVIIGIVMLILMLIIKITGWLNDNWELAEKRAKEELNGNRRINKRDK